jgi:hypothetical protein
MRPVMLPYIVQVAVPLVKNRRVDRRLSINAWVVVADVLA